MKYILQFFLILTFNISLLSQNTVSCCQASSIKSFTDLANDISFVLTHEEPMPFTLQNPKGQNITFPVNGGEAGIGYYIKGAVNNTTWIFVFQEWWGLNDYIKLESDKLHEAFPDAHILAIDLYDGKVATTREEASSLMQNVSPERIENLIMSASEFSGNKSRIGTIGWCFGGAWSNKAAVILSEKCKASVLYYGMPVKDEVQIKTIKAPVLGIFADQDGWITPKVVNEFKDLMIKNGKSVEIYGYDAHHAFANPSNPKYHKEFSQDAWAKTITFFRKHL